MPQSEFNYSYGDCTRNTKGAGWYVISGKELILHFQKDSTKDDLGTVDSTFLPRRVPRICEIRLTIVDKNTGAKLSFAHVSVVSDSASNLVACTDTDGVVVLRVPLQKVDEKIRISEAFHKALTISLSTQADYKIKAFLADSCEQVPDSKIYKFKIKRKTSDFQLVPGKGEHFYKETKRP